MPSKIQIVALANNRAEILIHQKIGEGIFDEGITSKNFIRDLAELGDVNNILVRINSPGGEVFSGIAIYNALKSHPAKIDVVVEGMAASIASVIAMSGDTVRMGVGAMMMVHNPMTIALGNAEDMRKTAGMLDQVGEALVDVYEKRTGMKRQKIKDMLAAETFMTSGEAVAMGFADSQEEETEDESVAALRQANINVFKNAFKEFAASSAKVSPSQIAAVLQSVKPDATTEVTIMPTPATASVQPTDIEKAALAAAQKAEVLAAENARRLSIRNEVFVGAFAEQHRAILDACLDDVNCSVDGARAKLLAELGKDAKPMGGVVEITRDVRDRFRAGAQKAILARAGMEKDEAGNEFRGMSLVALASHALGLAGTSTRGLTAREVASKVFAAHSTSDFPYLLANTAGKALLRGYDVFPRTWQTWCATRSVSDFKQVTNIQIGTFSSLLTIPEGGEYKGGTISEARETNQAATKGRKISFTRQMLVNDDLGAFVGFAQKMGTAAARTVNADAYSVVNTNAALSDSVALFHATHTNLAGSGAVISATTISAGKLAMRKQKDVNNNEYLNIMPKYLLVPVALEDDAKEFISSTTKMGSNTNSAVPNIHRNSLEVVSDPTLDATSATAWYLAADPAIVELVQAVFIDGVQQPFIDEEVNFQTDALEMKVRLDYGFAAVDHRAGYKNAGA